MQAFKKAMRFTGLPTKDEEAATNNNSASSWFETQSWFSNINKGMQVDVIANVIFIKYSGQYDTFFRYPGNSWKGCEIVFHQICQNMSVAYGSQINGNVLKSCALCRNGMTCTTNA